MHEGFGFHHDLRFALDHHALERDAHLVDLDTALPNLQLDRLHGLGFALAEIYLRRLVAHFDIETFVSHVNNCRPVAHLHLMQVVSFVDEDLPLALLDRYFFIAVLDDFRSIVFDLYRLIVTNL